MRAIVLFSLVSVLVCAEIGNDTGKAGSNHGLVNRDRRYRLQSTDQLKIEYRYTPEYNEEVNVRPDGFVGLQLLGDVKVGGLTVDEARAAILEKARTRLRDPEITVLLEEFVAPYYVVAGEVNKPGRFDMRGEVTAMQAVAVAGGFKDTAKHSQVILVHPLNSDLGEARVLNLKEMLKGRRLEEDVALNPGDMLIVPQSAISKISRYVPLASLGTFISLAVRQ